MTIKMGQQLRMTPQLQQAIRLLQLSSIDLEMEIQEALDTNFMLEEVTPDSEGEYETSLDSPPAEPDSNPETVDLQSPDSTEPGGDSNDASGDGDFDDIPADPQLDGIPEPDSSTQVAEETMGEDLPVDTSWDEVYDDNYGSPAPVSDGDENYLETRNAGAETIQTYLLEQINLLHLTDSDRFIAEALVDGLDDDGILRIELEDVLEAAPDEWELEMEEVEAVLHLIQHLDPVGIASRSLKECLTIQLLELPRDTPYRDSALTIVDQFLPQLANRDYTLLSRKLRLKEDQLKTTIDLIQSLDPRPGSNIGEDRTEYVEPDVIVSRKDGRWMVELNPKSAPRIRVNPEYAAMIKRGDSSDDSNNMRNHLQEAKWFIKSLQQRNDTLLRVSTKIVEYQRGFLEYGEQAMKPLVLHDIAEAVDLHESTISRVTTQKYMLTPAGVFELKYFFSSHVSTSSGGEVSSTAIRALIKKLVADENPRKPLSDSKIARLLEDQNINVARRTIAKYRELLMIPPSNERKQLI